MPQKLAKQECGDQNSILQTDKHEPVLFANAVASIRSCKYIRGFSRTNKKWELLCGTLKASPIHHVDVKITETYITKA